MGSKATERTPQKQWVELGDPLRQQWDYVVCLPGVCRHMSQFEKKYREDPGWEGMSSNKAPPDYKEPLIFHIHLVSEDRIILKRLSSKSAAKSLFAMLMSVWDCVEKNELEKKKRLEKNELAKGEVPLKTNGELSALAQQNISVFGLKVDQITDLIP